MICPHCHKETVRKQVQAIQWTGKNLAEVQAFIAPEKLTPVIHDGKLVYNDLIALLLEGVRFLVPRTDWILWRDGKLSVCQDKVFQELYEVVR